MQDTKKIIELLQIKALLPMQLECMKEFKGNGDFVLYSPTGSGKTLGFLLPMLQQLTQTAEIQTLIITPTRELGLQIEQVFKSFKTEFRVCCFRSPYTFQYLVN